jgi:sirohydrochlorin ferrochelatase
MAFSLRLGRASNVILAAHGAGDGSGANRGLLRLADALVEQRSGVRFQCAFWKGTPTFEDAARSLRGQAPVVVPIMASGGFYARRRLPEECAKGDPSNSFVLAPPIGTLEAFPRVLATKVSEAVTDMTRRGLDPVVLLVGHGASRIRSSGDSARRIEARLALTFPRTEIITAFLDEFPYLADVAMSLGDRAVVVAPLLLGGGPHVSVDLVRAFDTSRTSSGQPRASDTLRILPPILDWPELASLALEAIDSASVPAAWRGPKGRPRRVRFAESMSNSLSLPLRVGSPSVP